MSLSHAIPVAVTFIEVESSGRCHCFSVFIAHKLYIMMVIAIKFIHSYGFIFILFSPLSLCRSSLSSAPSKLWPPHSSHQRRTSEAAHQICVPLRKIGAASAGVLRKISEERPEERIEMKNLLFRVLTAHCLRARAWMPETQPFIYCLCRALVPAMEYGRYDYDRLTPLFAIPKIYFAFWNLLLLHIGKTLTLLSVVSISEHAKIKRKKTYCVVVTMPFMLTCRADIPSKMAKT